MSKLQPITSADNWFRGERKQFAFLIEDASDTPQTMTGWTLAWNLYRREGVGTALLTLTTASEITINNGNGTDDRAVVSVTAAQSDGLPAGSYSYDLRRTDAGSEQVLAYGPAELQNTQE